uniref:Uncharacterized protein n=1 Tax=Candidatus Kentrum sp. FW TaxID=2126338 RepID=A0A450SPQ4_9GAMM|nr:MAG: hypothetical protein BECKFW1821B_GA0114236_10254 [Candidatus Kentron sp. FW]
MGNSSILSRVNFLWTTHIIWKVTKVVGSYRQQNHNLHAVLCRIYAIARPANVFPVPALACRNQTKPLARLYLRPMNHSAG